MHRNYVWVVVSVEDGRPVHVDGAYGTRDIARAVKTMLDDDAYESDNKHVVTKMTFLVQPDQIRRE